MTPDYTHAGELAEAGFKLYEPSLKACLTTALRRELENDILDDALQAAGVSPREPRPHLVDRLTPYSVV